MGLAEGISKMGFRRWYERRLLQSHAHLALTFLCAVGLFAAFEAAWRFKGWTDQLTDFAAALVCGGTGLWALRRYLFLLGSAEVAANQAACARCDTYGRLELLRAEPAAGRLRVRCRHCGHDWLMHD